MPKVRLSGTVRGESDPARVSRAELLSELFTNGWDIHNSNGDEQITLGNIEEKIIRSDAFVFTPGATLEDYFKAISVFVGYQTLDANLQGKPTVILNGDGSWKPFYDLLNHLREMGTIGQDYRDFLIHADHPNEVISHLTRLRKEGLPSVGRENGEDNTEDTTSFETPLPEDSKGNVCVFCSATIEDEGYLRDGERLGRELAENKLGCVSGAGKTGVMGAVVRGSVDAEGWTGGSNVPHIIRLEGLPKGLSSFWLRDDIYTRMEIMIERSNSFIAFPGGAGTVQEVLALLIFKQQKNLLMENKPVILFNRENEEGVRFWDPFISLLEAKCSPGMFHVVDDLDDLVPTTLREMEQFSS
ncbi:MAG: LOG family protein [Akkermansiaceae bacterium]|jgi:uncharacterized protein (TIGR00730 family)|tara:strand:+ start:1572 stop:2642 length:1071 start_codon:yes stop_codon:yes gene_type:complete